MNIYDAAEICHPGYDAKRQQFKLALHDLSMAAFALDAVAQDLAPEDAADIISAGKKALATIERLLVVDHV